MACPYCGERAIHLPTSAPLYRGRDYGPVYICVPCQAWVGCHPGTDRPLGRLADAALRRARVRAHDAFDATWRPAGTARSAAAVRDARADRYRRLAELLNLPRESCHIGMFDLATCERVIEFCRRGALTRD